MTILKHADFEVPNFGEFANEPFAVPSYRDAVMSFNPKAYWRMSETGGTTLADETGAHDLSVSGPIAFDQDGALQGDSDRSLLLGAGVGEAQMPLLPSDADAAFTLAFWVRLPTGTTTEGSIISQYTGSIATHARIIIAPGGRLRLFMVNRLNFYSSQWVTDDWQFVALVRTESGLLRWYFDAELDASRGGSGVSFPPVSFRIGAISTSFATCYLDELALFDHALSLDDLRYLYSLGQAEFTLPTTS